MKCRPAVRVIDILYFLSTKCMNAFASIPVCTGFQSIKTPLIQIDWRAKKERNPACSPLYVQSVGLNELQHLTAAEPN